MALNLQAVATIGYVPSLTPVSRAMLIATRGWVFDQLVVTQTLPVGGGLPLGRDERPREPCHPDEPCWPLPVVVISEEIARSIEQMDLVGDENFERVILETSVSIGVVVDGGGVEKKLAADLAVFAVLEEKKQDSD